MLDFIEQVLSTVSPPVSSHDMPIESDNLPVTNPVFIQDRDIEDVVDADFVGSEDPDIEDEFDIDDWDEADLLHRDDTILWDEE